MRETKKRRDQILLVNPPVYDFRLDWARWHQPTGLLQYATLLKDQKKDVKLIDCLYVASGERLSRRRIKIHEIDGYKIHKWHFGLSFEEIEARINRLLDETWKPETVLVTSLNSIWWESTRDTITLLRRLLPKTKILLGGAYPTVEHEHAVRNSGADKIVVGSIPDAAKLSPDILLYPQIPSSTGIYFYPSSVIYETPNALRHRALGDIFKEIKAKAKLGVREFVFFDQEIYVKDRDSFGKLLDKIASAELNIRFVLPGNVSPSFITQDLARKMRRAHVTQVYLKCDLQFLPNTYPYTTALSDYERCAKALIKHGGFAPRGRDMGAMLVVGLPYEDLDAVSERLIRLASIVGSVILVPFQYVPGVHKGALFDRALAQNGHFSPEMFNSKLFPLALLSGKKFEDYMELTRLAALLNSKYRSKTFDFLGDGLAAKMFRESIRTEGWNPFSKTEKSDLPLEIIPLLPMAIE